MQLKRKIRFSQLVTLGLVLMLISNCKKDVPATLPQVETHNASSIFSSSATISGAVISVGGSAIDGGVCWSTNPTPTTSDNVTIDASGVMSFLTTLSGLTPNTTYYYAAYATNSIGTGYGDILSFKTGQTAVNDIDGNGYDTVIIGSQVWMVQNLEVTHYRNGDSIPNVIDNTQWSKLIDGAYSNYNNNTDIAGTYGRLYNAYAVLDSRGICPTGWHIPSDIEWKTLESYLGQDNAGGKMKEAGTKHWKSPNTKASNVSGFSALPGSYRDLAGHFFDPIGYAARWWSSTEVVLGSVMVPGRHINYDGGLLYSQFDFYDKEDGLSVRCVIDN